MVKAILKEIDLRKDFFSVGSTVDSIYFGGGTPSILSEGTISEILNRLHQIFSIHKNPEITLEANPDDLTDQKLLELNNAGINRLSIGIQSFHDEELKIMNRVHNANEAERCVKAAQDIGITNLSIDLIFGMPDSTIQSWSDNIQKALEYDVPHMSCYSLTVEPKTALAHMIKKGKTPKVDDEVSAAQYQLTISELSSQGYEHYEISSYARDQQYAVHNTNYWRFIPYLGLGPSAHSYDGQRRAWNVANNALYVKAIDAAKPPLEFEQLSSKDRLNEYLMTGLRTMWGCEWNAINEIIPGASDRMNGLLKKFEQEALIEINQSGFKLSEKGKFYADQISSDLFVV